MTTFGCPECGRNWQEGPTRDYTEYYMCRKCIEALAREAGEAMRKIIVHTTDPIVIAHADGPLTKLCSAGLLKGGE